MTKGKLFVSAVAVMAAAGAVVTGVLIKNRGKIKVEGEVEAKKGHTGLGGNGSKRSVRGSAQVRTNASAPKSQA